MVIELLGTRIIAPFYGVSLYVWSSLISVALIALAIGYFAGGRWADRAKRTGLSLIISLAALFTLLIPWITRPVLLVTDALGLRAGAFVSALVLFSPSLTLLGMVGPYAIKLTTSRLEGVGTSAGSIYAVSTLGSVVGTLLLGFFLFPMVGSRAILIGLGVALLALAVAVAIYEQTRLGRTAAVLPSVLLAAIGIALLPGAVGAGRSNFSTGGAAGHFSDPLRAGKPVRLGAGDRSKESRSPSPHVGCLDDRRRQHIEWREPAHLPGHSGADPGVGAGHETRFAHWPGRRPYGHDAA